MSNAKGVPNPVRVNIARDMEIYDSLPPELRAAIREAVLDYAAIQAQSLLLRLPAAQLIAVIRDRDAKIIGEHRRRVALRLPLCPTSPSPKCERLAA